MTDIPRYDIGVQASLAGVILLARDSKNPEKVFKIGIIGDPARARDIAHNFTLASFEVEEMRKAIIDDLDLPDEYEG